VGSGHGEKTKAVGAGLEGSATEVKNTKLELVISALYLLSDELDL
jgi:hypothetical protein